MNISKIIIKDPNDSNFSYFLYKMMFICFIVSILSLAFIFQDSYKAYKYFLNGTIGFLFLGFIRNMIIIKNKEKKSTN